MHRIAQIKANLKHRRSKSDSQLDNFSIACLTGEVDVDDFETFDDGNEEANFAKPAELQINEADQVPTIDTTSEVQRNTSSSNLPFIANFGGNIRRKFGSHGSLKVKRTDSSKLTPTESYNDFMYDNDGLQARSNQPPSTSVITHPLEAAFDIALSSGGTFDLENSGHQDAVATNAPAVDEFGAPAWVTFDDGNDDNAKAENSTEFVEIPLDDDTKALKTSQKIVQNLKKIPLRFKSNSRYQSLESDNLGIHQTDEERLRYFAAQRSNSLPSTPSTRQKIFGNLRR